MHGYINQYGHYPTGLFASVCKGTQQGLPCPALAPSQSADRDDTSSSQINCKLSLVYSFATTFMGILMLMLLFWYLYHKRTGFAHISVFKGLIFRLLLTIFYIFMYVCMYDSIDLHLYGGIPYYTWISHVVILNYAISRYGPTCIDGNAHAPVN